MPVVPVWCGDCSEFMENVGPVVTGRDRGSQRSAAAAKTKKLAQQLVSKTSTAVGPQPAGEKHLLPFIDAVLPHVAMLARYMMSSYVRPSVTNWYCMEVGCSDCTQLITLPLND